jgi:transcription antitermination factor NusG
VKIVGNNGAPAEIPETVIDSLRHAVDHEIHLRPHPYLLSGQKVFVHSGPFRGFAGILLKNRGQLRVVVSLEIIGRSFVIDITAADIEPLFPLKASGLVQ